MHIRHGIIVMLLFVSGCFWSHEHTDTCCHHEHENKQAKQVTIGFMGDVMLGRGINEVIKQQGPAYIWGNMLPVLTHTDINIANLETTLTRSTNKVTKIFNFKADPEYVQVLKQGHISVVNLANNHSLDFGTQGLKDTLTALNKAHIRTVGAGMNEQAARRPLIFHKHGIKIGVLGYTDNEPTWDAQGNKPGTNYIAIPDIQRIKNDIRKIRHAVDVLIVTLHWGPNMKDTPLQTHSTAAHELIDAGADIIHGHSAHVFQGIELYKNKLILYDTGDFIDDYAIDDNVHNDWSAYVKVTYEKKVGITKVKLIPIVISSMQVHQASAEIKQTILKLFQERSRAFGTKINDDTLMLASPTSSHTKNAMLPTKQTTNP